MIGAGDAGPSPATRGRVGAGVRCWHLLAAATLLLALFLSPAAWAHAVLVEADPADGARVESLPGEVRLRFNEPVSLVAVRAFGPGGAALVLPATATATDDTLRIPLPVRAPGAEPPPGVYTVSYRVTSADGHPVAGSLLFGVGITPEPAPPPPVGHSQDATLAIAVIARALHYGSLLAAAGGGLFVALVAPGLMLRIGRDQVPLAAAARLSAMTGIAAAAALLNLGLAGALLTGRPPAALADPEAWRAALSSTSGTSAGIALAGLALLALGLSNRLANRLRAGRRALLLAGALAAVGALAATGHAATAPPRGLAAPLVVLHGLTAAFWLGSLGPLRVILRHAPSVESARLFRRFSHGAIAAVAVLTLAGAGLSVLQIVDPATVAGTAYGQIWLVKMVGVAALLGLASVNRLRLTPGLAAGPRAGRERAQRLLALSIATETVLMAVLLLLTAGLGTTPPPRTLGSASGQSALGRPSAEAAGGYTSAVLAKERQAVITIDPARPGMNRLTLHLAQPDGFPFDPKELTVALSLPSAGIEPITRRPARIGDGAYRLDGLALPVAGRWEVRIDALIDDFEKVVFRATLPVEAR